MIVAIVVDGMKVVVMLQMLSKVAWTLPKPSLHGPSPRHEIINNSALLLKVSMLYLCQVLITLVPLL